MKIAVIGGRISGLVAAYRLFTFFLGVGVYRLAQRQALVRQAVSVENIGRVSCICSDKTGTIMEGKLQLAHAIAGTSQSLTQTVRLAERPKKDRQFTASCSTRYKSRQGA